MERGLLTRCSRGILVASRPRSCCCHPSLVVEAKAATAAATLASTTVRSQRRRHRAVITAAATAASGGGDSGGAPNPWHFGAQTNERLLHWDASAQAQLMVIWLCQEMRLERPALEARVAALANLLPDLAAKLHALRAPLVLELLQVGVRVCVGGWRRGCAAGPGGAGSTGRRWGTNEL